MDHQEDTKAIAYRAMADEVLRHAPVAIYNIDLIQQRFLMVNKYMCQEIGYSEEELLKLNPLDILTPKSGALFIQRLTAMAAGKPVSTNVEVELVKKNGDYEWVRLHIHHIREGDRITKAYVVGYSINEQIKAQEELANNRLYLEKLVDERTRELARANERLRGEIEHRGAATEKLRAYSKRLEEMNTAMRVLLDKRNEDHKRAQELIRLHLKELIDPYLERLENSELRSYQRQLVDVIRTNVDEVMAADTPAVSSKFFMFSPNELQVVNLIRTGKTTKEMARLLNLSTRTIEAYRNSIRKKLNLKHKKINLRTYLSSF